jgi:hypothetical protein
MNIMSTSQNHRHKTAGCAPSSLLLALLTLVALPLVEKGLLGNVRLFLIENDKLHSWP